MREREGGGKEGERGRERGGEGEGEEERGREGKGDEREKFTCVITHVHAILIVIKLGIRNIILVCGFGQ